MFARKIFLTFHLSSGSRAHWGPSGLKTGSPVPTADPFCRCCNCELATPASSSPSCSVLLKNETYVCFYHLTLSQKLFLKVRTNWSLLSNQAINLSSFPTFNKILFLTSMKDNTHLRNGRCWK